MNTNVCWYVLTLIILMIQQSLHCQSTSIDSLQILFYSTPNDSLRRELTDQLSKAYTFMQADSSVLWAQRGLEIAKKGKDKDGLGKSHYYLGKAIRNNQNPALGMEHLMKAVERFRETNNETWLMDAELEIGLVYQEMDEFALAKKYLDRFYQYYLQKEDGPTIIFAINQYVVLYEQMLKPDSMLYYGKQTLKAAQQYNLPRYLGKIHNNLAATYLYLEDYENAKIHFREAAKEGFGGEVSAQYFNYYAQADLYRLLGQLDSATILAKQALETAQSFGDLGKEADIHKFLSEVYVDKQAYKQAYEEVNNFIRVKDSITVLRHEQNIAELGIQYETQKKEAQIAQQQLLLEKERNRRNLILFLAIGALAVAGAIFFFIQNRKRQAELELEFQAAESERLRSLDRMKSNFFANISHEFRTPLTLLIGPLREMLNDTFKGDSKKYFAIMVNNGERLLRLVNQLLDLSRLESKSMPVDLQAADLPKFVQRIALSFETWAMRKKIFFQTNFPSKALIAFFDSDKLEKILSNLLSNALKFTPENGRIRIDFSVVKQTEAAVEVEIKVEDNGAGITPAHLPHVFDRFYSQPKENQEMQGSGIGLALTKELVELQGGTVKVESEPQQFTRFTLLMPFKLADKITVDHPIPPIIDEYVEETSPGSFQRIGTTRPVVLIVEDNRDLRTYIKDQLKDKYQIVEAVNGKQGLHTALEVIPDLILTDVMMPEMDGLSLCKELKENEITSHIPVIVLTARSGQENKLSSLSTGADAFLAKPFDARELQIRTHFLIQQRQKLREKFAEGLSQSSTRPEFVSPMEESFLQKVVEVVEANLDNDEYSIEELSRAIGMSRSQLHRKIKAITDQSPSVFVRTLRLQHAYQLLERKAGNISEIAFKVGIPNLAYFSRCFSDQFGFPPSSLLHK